jgi:hypothetical protein
MASQLARGAFYRRPIIFEGDEYWSDVISLLQFSEASGSTSVTDAADASPKPAWTFRATAQVSSGQSKFGNNLLGTYDGSGVYNNVDALDSNLGTHDFTANGWTIDCWWRCVTDSAVNPVFHIGNASGDYVQLQATSGLAGLQLSSVGQSPQFATQTLATALSVGVWYYLRLVVTSTGEWYLSKNATLLGSGSDLAWNGSKVLRWNYAKGSLPVHNSGNVRIDDARLTLNTRATSGFVVPTQPAPTFQASV